MPEFQELESGPKIEVTREQGDKLAAGFEEVLRLAQLSGSHVWTAIMCYSVPNLPDIIAGKTQLFLDTENIAYGPATCCFRCEEPYSERLATRRCKGTGNLSG